MHKKDYFQTTTVLFAVVAFLHIGRVLAGWSMVIGGYVVPSWLSLAVGAFVIYLAYSGNNLSNKK